MLKKDHGMKDKKRIEVLLKVIKRIYSQTQEMQEMIATPMVEVCTEGVKF